MHGNKKIFLRAKFRAVWYTKTMEHPTGTTGTFYHPSLSQIGTMTGAIEDDLFIPDEEFHDRLFHIYGVEGEAGLFLEQGVFTAAGG